MKTGKTLVELAQEISRQSALKRDFVAPTNELVFLTGPESGTSELVLPQGKGEFTVTDLAHRQIAHHLGIPGQYYDRIRGDQALRPLFDRTVNDHFRAHPTGRMVRTLDGSARAFLSDRYRIRDNDQVAEHVLPILGEIPDVQIASADITDTNLYIKAVAPRVQGEVAKGDFVQAGVVIRNSEVGLGSLQVDTLIYRLVCTNGMIAETTARHFHLGRQIDSETAVEVFRSATMIADDRAFFMKLADVVRAAVDETNFRRLLGKMQQAAASQPLVNPAQGLKELTQKYRLSDDEHESVLRHLIMGGDLTKWGALNAITRTAEDVKSYDRATELEAVGGQVLNLSERDWTIIANTQQASVPVRRAMALA